MLDSAINPHPECESGKSRATLAHDPETWIPVFGKDHAQTTAHDPEKWTPVFGKDHANERTAAVPRSQAGPATASSVWSSAAWRSCPRRRESVPPATKNSSLVRAGLAVASSDARPGLAIGPGGSPSTT